MPPADIPQDLVQMLAEQRVIPFIGSGFSAALQLPQWDALLRKLAADLQQGAAADETVTYEEIASACREDHLQIAEYLFLRAGEAIGPIRQAISTSLQGSAPVTDSTPHVELVNLAAPQVYTTNYDDLLESCYRALDQQVDVIAVARDVALAEPTRSQVVKYHGDLRYEDTLVLTESQYYQRLEFESPMDLKLRADLLGRGVLFIGYSFSDINIRVIWFKLMQTMREVPEKDRLPSFIVRLRANPVLDRLYEAVGLKTIVIDPDGAAEDDQAATACLSDFMLRLTTEVARRRQTPGGAPMFLSRGLLSAIRSELPSMSEQRRTLARLRGRDAGTVRPDAGSTQMMARLHTLVERRIPTSLIADSASLMDEVARQVSFWGPSGLAAQLPIWILEATDESPGATLMVCAGLMRYQSRETLLHAELPWEKVWVQTLTEPDAQYLLDVFEGEVNGHRDLEFEDADVAYGADVAIRIARGELIDMESPSTERAKDLVEALASIYSEVAGYDPPVAAAPDPVTIIDQIDEAAIKREEGEDAAEASMAVDD
jgi:hypothetical protein